MVEKETLNENTRHDFDIAKKQQSECMGVNENVEIMLYYHVLHTTV